VSDRARFLYLHGFASSPGSRKALRFRDAFARRDRELVIPDLNPSDFRDRTGGGMLDVAERAVRDGPDGPVGIIGSSLGGYLATLLLSRLSGAFGAVLLAPAFDLRTRWSRRLGPDALAAWQRIDTIRIFHHGLDRECSLGYRFYEESAAYPAYPDPGGVPLLMFHGRADEVVPLEAVEEFTRRQPGARLRVVEDDHSLLDAVDGIVRESVEFFDECLG